MGSNPRQTENGAAKAIELESEVPQVEWLPITSLMLIALLYTLDRLMNYQDRLLYNMQYFHGTLDSDRLHLRAMALLWNFHPYGSRTKFNNLSRSSPFKDLNGFRYHDNWLRNLLIAGSMNGY